MTTPTSAYEEAFLPGPSAPFYTRTYLPPFHPPRGAVLFVHGFADHVARHAEHAAWARRGVVLFAYDLRGFGRTVRGGDGDGDGDGKDKGKGKGKEGKGKRKEGKGKRKEGTYGRTDARRAEEDLAWWVAYVARRWAGVPVFLMGYSAGGGSALAFCTKPEWAEYVAKLAGVIALSPLFVLTHPAPPVLYAAVKLLDYVAPHMTVPAPMPEERFSRDPTVVEKLRRDPLRKAQATPRALVSMFAECRKLLDEGWKSWPKGLPVLGIHGSADAVNSCDATVEWFDKVDAEDKKLVVIEGAYHDLMNEIEDIPERVSEEYMGWVEAHL